MDMAETAAGANDDDVDSDGDATRDREQAELQQAWERLIREELKEIPRRAFPNHDHDDDHDNDEDVSPTTDRTCSWKPTVEIRPQDRLAVVSVPTTRPGTPRRGGHRTISDTTNPTTPPKDERLLLVFVQDTATQQLLSAGSLDDLFRYTPDAAATTTTTTTSTTATKPGRGELGILQCTLPRTTRQVVVSVLYEPHSNNSNDENPNEEHEKEPLQQTTTTPPPQETQVIYTYQVQVPPELIGDD